jgi:Transmembrane protein 65
MMLSRISTTPSLILSFKSLASSSGRSNIGGLKQQSVSPNFTIISRRCLQLSTNNKRTHLANTNSNVSKRIHSSTKSESAVSPSDLLVNSTQSFHAPSRDQLKSLFLSSAVPMIGFGFMDNFIMIQAGGYIDATLGVTMGLATLTAAAMGQVFSDVSGVLFGGTVERLSERLRLVNPAHLTQAQRALPLCRNITMAGSVFGIILGCLLGASSLFFVDLEAHDRQKRAAELKDVVTCMLASDEGLYEQGCTLYLTSKSSKFHSSLVGQESTMGVSGPQIYKLTDKASMATQCAQRRAILSDDTHMFVPVMARDGSTALGVLEFRKALHADDEKTGTLVARHLAIFMERMD